MERCQPSPAPARGPGPGPRGQRSASPLWGRPGCENLLQLSDFPPPLPSPPTSPKLLPERKGTPLAMLQNPCKIHGVRLETLQKQTKMQVSGPGPPKTSRTMQVSSQQAHSVVSASYFSASDTNFPTSQQHIVASRTHFPTSLKHFPAPRTYFPVSLNHFCIARVQVDTPRSNFATTPPFSSLRGVFGWPEDGTLFAFQPPELISQLPRVSVQPPAAIFPLSGAMLTLLPAVGWRQGRLRQ